jgi:hypothetical protein
VSADCGLECMVGHLFAVFWISKSVPLNSLKLGPEHFSISHLSTSLFDYRQGYLYLLVVIVII